MNFSLFLKHLPVWPVPSRPFGVHDGKLQLSGDGITMRMMITVFWNIAPCRLVICYRPFGGVVASISEGSKNDSEHGGRKRPRNSVIKLPISTT